MVRGHKGNQLAIREISATLLETSSDLVGSMVKSVLIRLGTNNLGFNSFWVLSFEEKPRELLGDRDYAHAQTVCFFCEYFIQRL